MPIVPNSPIPGESLTREPGNAPWEQPPLYSTPQEALDFYFEKFEDNEDDLDDILFLLDKGFPVSTFVDSLTTCGVMEGYHTLDVAQLINPVIHEFITELGKTAGIDVVEFDGPSEEDKKQSKKAQRMQLLVAELLEEEPSEDGMDTGEPLPSPELETEETSPAPTGNGLVSRR